ncbi:MAG: DUF6788 family protein [Steroidobacteraceae bacterium]
MPRARLSQHERRLEALRSEYEAAKARLADVGFTCEGSLIERYTSCHNPRCRCADPAQRHGPYWQLSWKQAGRTISKIISAEEAALYQQWTAHRRSLEDILAEMRDISRQAGEHATTAAGHPFVGPSRRRRRPER